MMGVTSFGAYIPRWRLERMAIFKAMGWLAPAIVTAARGERSMCSWDEDSITMAVAAVRDCLRGRDKQQLDALYLASTTLPFADRIGRVKTFTGDLLAVSSAGPAIWAAFRP
jgi:3-hydroxy-3-methylglutaryl CoA synthase